MQFQFFKSLFSKLSIVIENIQVTFLSEDQKASKNPLYNSFQLYAKEDFKLALDLLKNGYQATTKQLNNLNNSLIKDAITNKNFLFKYNSYLSFLPPKAIINYCLYHDLSDPCKNDKTIFDNFKHVFVYFSDQKHFSPDLYSTLKSTIFNRSLKCSELKPKYEHIHAFELSSKEEQLCSRFRASIYNSLLLIPYMVQTMDEFVSLKTTIEQSIDKIDKNLQKHNVRIVDLDQKVLHYNASNREIFQMPLLKGWITFLETYDTKKLQKALIEQITSPIVTEEFISNNVKKNQKNKTNSVQNDINEKINLLKSTLTNTQQQQINTIQELYQQVHGDMFEKKHHHDLDSLYKDLPNVIEKFISIHPDYRNTLTNIEGKTPEQLMVESFVTIENKFKSYLEEINQNKVTDLSIVGRAIKMKA